MSEAVAKLREHAVSQLTKAGVSNIDESKLDTIVDRLKTIASNKDATLVSGSDPAELETVRKNFVVKHCGESDKDKGAAAVTAVAEQMGGAGIKMKNRAAFYYLVAEKIG